MLQNFFTKDLIQNRFVEVGDYTYGQPAIHYAAEDAPVKIGRFTSMAFNIQFFLKMDHRPDWVTNYPFSGLGDMFPQAMGIEGHPTCRGGITIGNDVWIAANVIVLSGVTIGDGAVVMQGSVVTEDVPPYAIFAGNPARLLRYRFSPEQIASLLAIRWWDWPPIKMQLSLKDLCSGDIDAFIAKHKPA
jgi:acetyltransferase-like isoleucine patch superfamily enzyme